MTREQLRQIQEQQKEWQERNFGIKPRSHRCLLGMIEEIGEYSEAESEADREDAVGDFLIYSIGYCNDWEIDFDDVVQAADIIELSERDHMLHALGKLSHAHLKSEQGIRTDRNHDLMRFEAMALLVALIKEICTSQEMDFGKCLTDTWAHVMQRDWEKNKVNGGA